MQQALLCLRMTPVNNEIPRPLQSLMNQMPQQIENIYKNRLDIAHRQAEQLKKGRKNITSQLLKNQQVYTRISISDSWETAIVERIREEPNSYDLLMPNGRILRRARHQIRYIPKLATTTEILNENITKLPLSNSTNTTIYTPTITIPYCSQPSSLQSTHIPIPYPNTTNSPVINNNTPSTDPVIPLRRSQRTRRPPARYTP